MERTATLNGLAGLVRSDLESLNRELVADLRPRESDLHPLVEHVGGYKGKQMRPALVFLAAKACGGAQKEHMTVAKVVELLHTATLLHDDVLDGADMRRRIPTVNAMQGTEVAVLLGDYIYAKAFHMAVSLDDPACARWLAETVRVICQGEITQILHRFDLEWDEARYYRVIEDKTASLYASACWLGGHYAGAQPAQKDALETFGRELGIAFQIVDDILDLEGDERIVGKSLGTDMEKGKLTLPLLWLMQDPKGAAGVRAALKAPEGQRMEVLRDNCDLAGALSYARTEAERRVDLAQEALLALPASEYREAMHRLAGYVLGRDH